MNPKTIQYLVCSGALGLWTLVRAPTPTRFRCPQCKIRLQLVGRKWPLYLVGFLLGAIIVGPGSILVFALLVKPLGLLPAVLLAVGAFVVLAVLAEISISRYILNCRRLEVR